MLHNNCVPKDCEDYFTVEPKLITVSKRRFDRFIKRYPRKLVKAGHYVCTPTMISFNDFELANKFPYSMVAQYWESYCGSKVTYKICINYRKLFKNRTPKIKEGQ